MEIEEVFDYYDMPLLFTCRNLEGNLFLTLLINDDTWLYIPLTDEKLGEMKRKEVDLYEVFLDRDEWFYATNSCHELIFKKSSEKPTDDMLPLRGEYLTK